MSDASPRPNSLTKWVPRHLLLPWDVSHDSAWIEHAPFLAWLIGEHRPGSFVELGSHWGFSYFAAVEAAKAVGLAMDSVAIDTWEGDMHAGEYGEGVYEYVRARNEEVGGAGSRLFRGYFDEALDTVADGSVDLLHIDGLHTYEASRHDFDAWLPKMSTRGVVLFHDTAERAADFGVYRTWAEVSATYPAFAFTHGHGLGVLLVGSEVNEPLRELAASNSSDAGEAVRRLFWQLGRNVGWESALRSLTSAMSATVEGGQARERAGRSELGLAEVARPLIARQAELLEDRDQTHHALRRARGDLEATRQALNTALAREEALAVQVNQLTETVEALTGSASWRLTAGLRALKRTIGRSS